MSMKMTQDCAGLSVGGVRQGVAADARTAGILELPRVTLFPTFALMQEKCGGLSKIEDGGREQAEIENGQH
jgi:hypothetical protein